MFQFPMTKNKKVKVKDLYRVEFTGSREPIWVCANSFGEAANIGNRLALHDEVSTSVIAIKWMDAIVVFE